MFLKKKKWPQRNPILCRILETKLTYQATHLKMEPKQVDAWPILKFTFLNLCHSGSYCSGVDEVLTCVSYLFWYFSLSRTLINQRKTKHIYKGT